MNGLSLFSGIGGIDIAIEEWVKPVIYCEIEPYCQAVLLSRMADESLPNAPIWDDIRTLSGLPFSRFIDIIYGGFPCQNISVAGRGEGLEGERSGLFFEILRLAKEIKPKFIFLENVPAITTRGGLRVVREIAAMGYDCRWCIISAASIGALHQRKRWFLLAYAKHDGTFTSETGKSFRESIASGQQHIEKEGIRKTERTSSLSSNVANAQHKRLEGWKDAGQTKISKSWNDDTFSNDGNSDSQSSQQTNSTSLTNESAQYWPFESREHWQKIVSEMGKCSNGISNHVDRLKSLGNAVVPNQVRKAFQILSGIDMKNEYTFFEDILLKGEESKEPYIEFGCSEPISFLTSKGIKTLKPNNLYNENLNEISCKADLQ